MRKSLFAALAVAMSLTGLSVPAYANEADQDLSAAESAYVVEDQGVADQESAVAPQEAEAVVAEAVEQTEGSATTSETDLVVDDQVSEEQPEGTASAQAATSSDDQASSSQTEEAATASDAVSSQVEADVEGEANTDDAAALQDTAPAETVVSANAGDETDDGEQIDEVVTIAPQDASKTYVSSSNDKVSSTTSADTLASYWQVVEHSDGSYSYRNAKTNAWLGVESTDEGALVQLRNDLTCRWRRFKSDKDIYALALASDEDLRLSYATGATGLILRLARATDSSSQLFLIKAHESLTKAAGSGKVVDPGLVTIATDAAKSRVVDVRAGSKADQANIQIYDSNSSLAQKWELEYQGAGLYTLRSANSGKMLDVRGGSVKSGANIQQYKSNETLAQYWYFVKEGNVLSLRSAKSGLALEAAKSGSANGTNVQLGSYDGSAGQRLTVTKTALLEDDGVYSFKANCASSLWLVANSKNAELGSASDYLKQYWRVVKDGTGFTLRNLAEGALQVIGKVASASDVRCSSGTSVKWQARIGVNGGIVLSPVDQADLALDVAGAGKKAGTNVRLWKSNDSAAQTFEISLSAALTEAARLGATLKDKVVTIVSALDKSKVIDIRAASVDNCANVQIYASNGTLAQKWELTSVGNGLYSLRVANSGKMLDVRGSSTKSGANVHQYTANGTLAQLWYLVPSNSGGYVVRSAKSGLALDIAGGKKANGTNVRVYTNNGTSAQRFLLNDTQLVSDGNHTISWSVCKPLVVDIASGSKAAGANVRLYIANGTAAQQFVFKQQSDGTYTIQNKNSGLYLVVKNSSAANGANIEQGKLNQGSASWRVVISPQGGLSFQNAKTGKYLEVADGTVRLGTNVRQSSSNGSLAQSFMMVDPGYNPKVGKIGWQNPAGYPQVSRYTVVLPSYARGSHSYVSPSIIRVDATREECIDAFIKRAYQYLGTPFNEPWSTEPGGVGVDCSGFVLQCLYATGMDLEHAAGTQYVGGYNPHNHYYVPAQTYNSTRWYEYGTFQRVSFDSARRGDLFFYGYYGSNGPVVHHVAIYLGNGQIIHSSNHAGSGNQVRIDSMYLSAYQNIIAVERPFV